MRKKRVIVQSRIWICLTFLFAVGFAVLFCRGDYLNKIAVKAGIKQSEDYSFIYGDRALAGWCRCLQQLIIQADVVFFGDSITHRSDFSSFFPDTVICNLGIGSDTLQGMDSRVSMISTVSPRKVFLLGGINSLKDDNVEESCKEYEQLLSDMIKSLNGVEIYVVSVLPVSAQKAEEIRCGNDTICFFNHSIQLLAEEKGIIYIDLFSKLLNDGCIDPKYTVDGVHLSDEAYSVWAETIREYIEPNAA